MTEEIEDTEEVNLIEDGSLIEKAENNIAKMKSHWLEIYDDAEECWKVYNLDQWTKEQKVGRENKRPMITADFIKPYIKQVLSDVFEKPQMIKLNARSDGNKLKAKALSEALRYIEDISNANDSSSWAMECTTVGGFGFIKADYDNSGDNENNEAMITIDRVSDPFSIYIDEKSTELDGSDMEYAVEFFSEDEYRYWYIEDNIVNWIDVKCDRIEDRGEFPTDYIPIVPVFGEYSLLRGNRSCYGMVKALVDSQREYNYLRSDVLERVANTPLATTIADEDSLSSEQERRLRNSPSKPETVLKYRGRDDAGNPIAPPSQLAVSPNIGYAQAPIAMITEGVRHTTGIISVESNNNAIESGVALSKRQAQSDRGQLVYTSHLQTSRKHLGLILLQLIDTLGTAQGKITIQDEKGSNNVVAIGQPTFNEMGQPLPFLPEISVGDSTISISSQPAYSVRKQEGVEKMFEMIAILNEEERARMIPKLIEDMGFPNSEEYANILRGQDANGGEQQQAMMQQQLQQMQQQNQQMQEQMQVMNNSNLQLQTELKTQSQAMLQKTQMDNQNKVNIENMKIQSNERIKMQELRMKDVWHNGDTQTDYIKEANKAEIANNKLEAEADKQNKNIMVEAIKDINSNTDNLSVGIDNQSFPQL